MQLESISAEAYSGGLELPSSYLEANKGLIFGSGNNRGDLISFGETDSQGRVVLNFPPSKRGRNSTGARFYLELSDQHREKERSVILIEEDDFSNNYLQLQQIKLLNSSELVFLNIRDNIHGFELLEYFFEGEIAYRILTVDAFENPIRFKFSDSFRVKENQTLFINYKLKELSSDEIFEDRIAIDVGNENLEFIIQNP
ncbi:hypothetical protein [Psychroflexus lacisalsi]|uniref:Uncharacterized protein n=1 Tax=Psychroflexus lacisalsi TaxID=503928 RepID=A0ABP3VDG9_9FLAO|nr:hypothetical protein [Psychroflexus lacisalsi]MBZ9619223.1 hypothetical protein [Psychroflexus lacisalsi]